MNPYFSRLFWTIRYTIGWLPFFLLYVLAMYVTRGSLGAAISQTVFYLWPGFLLGIPAWKFATHVSSGCDHWGSYFWKHLAGGSLFTIVWHLVFFGTIYGMAGREGLVGFERNQVIWMILTGLMVYSLLVGLSSIDRLSKQVRERELNAAKAENLRVRAEMEVLRGQLDPHFLFNTLHSITALVRENPAKAEEALLAFGDLLRHVIAAKREGMDELPLRDELAFIDRYLELERLRLGDRLSVERDCATAVLECWIPAFTIQPLVENAIRHAIAPHRKGGTISISAKLEKGRLIVSVADNGPGAEPGSWTNSKGVGIPAVSQRLQLRHQGAAEVKVETAPGKGFCVTLLLPAVRNAVVETVT